MLTLLTPETDQKMTVSGSYSYHRHKIN